MLPRHLLRSLHSSPQLRSHRLKNKKKIWQEGRGASLITWSGWSDLPLPQPPSHPTPEPFNVSCQIEAGHFVPDLRPCLIKVLHLFITEISPGIFLRDGFIGECKRPRWSRYLRELPLPSPPYVTCTVVTAATRQYAGTDPRCDHQRPHHHDPAPILLS